jgi:hypothetical protein
MGSNRIAIPTKAFDFIISPWFDFSASSQLEALSDETPECNVDRSDNSPESSAKQRNVNTQKAKVKLRI